MPTKSSKGQLKQNKRDGLDVSKSKSAMDEMDLEKLNCGYFLQGLAAGNTEVLLHKAFFVYQIEFDKTRWSCWWNSAKNCTQNSARAIFLACIKITIVQLFSVRSLLDLPEK